jgi:hypothetical protein
LEGDIQLATKAIGVTGIDRYLMTQTLQSMAEIAVSSDRTTHRPGRLKRSQNMKYFHWLKQSS